MMINEILPSFRCSNQALFIFHSIFLAISCSITITIFMLGTPVSEGGSNWNLMDIQSKIDFPLTLRISLNYPGNYFNIVDNFILGRIILRR